MRLVCDSQDRGADAHLDKLRFVDQEQAEQEAEEEEGSQVAVEVSSRVWMIWSGSGGGGGGEVGRWGSGEGEMNAGQLQHALIKELGLRV